MVQLENLRTKVVESGTHAAERGSEAARGAYGYVMNHPKTATAVVLGTGVAAALLWMVRRNGGYAETRRQVLERVRTAGQSARHKAEELAQHE